MYDKDYANFIARMGSFDDTLDLEDDEQELTHYGILGMKWGKRRAADIPERRMSNKELTARIKRLRMEDEFERLSKSTNPSVMTSVSKVAQNIGTVAVMTTTALTLYNNIEKIAKIAKKLST